MAGDLALLAARRGGLAALLGLLLLEEPGPGLGAFVADIAELAALASGDPAVATEYERVFLRGVPLYESVFCSSDGQHGGERLVAVMERYDRLGFDEHRDPRWRIAGADHLGMQLRCYAKLCHDESQAWRSAIPDAAVRSVELERSFLADHLAGWADVALDACLAAAADGPYHPLLQAVASFLAQEYETLRPAPEFGEVPAGDELPMNFGPARLVRMLLAPVSCGVWLSSETIGSAARSIGMPWRPSDTRSSLRHVIDSLDDTDDLAVVLGPIVRSVRASADRCDERRTAVGANGANSLVWSRRAAAMATLLERIGSDGRLGGAPSSATEVLAISGSDPAALADVVDRVAAELRASGFHVEHLDSHARGCGVD